MAGSLVFTVEGAINALQRIKDSGYYDTIGLFKNEVSLAPNLTLADLVEADFTGYSRKTIAPTWQAVQWNPGVPGADMKSFLFNWTGPANAADQTIYGAFGVNLAGVAQWMAIFDPPKLVPAGAYDFDVELRIQFEPFVP